jgi:hypothetical protein
MGDRRAQSNTSKEQESTLFRATRETEKAATFRIPRKECHIKRKYMSCSWRERTIFHSFRM